LKSFVFSKNLKLRFLIFVFLLLFYFMVGSSHIHDDSVFYFTMTEDAAINQSLYLRTDLPSVDEIEGRNLLLEKMEKNFPGFTTENFMDGQIDVLGIYNFELTAEQITALSTLPETTAFYNFDGDVLDSSGNANHGTVYGTQKFTAGQVGDAFDLNGSTLITLSNEGNFDFDRTDSYSFTAWINPDAIATQYLFDKRDALDGGYAFFLNNTNAPGFWTSSDSTHRLYVLANSTLSTDTWQHVAITYDGSSTPDGVTMYINGEVVDTTPVNESLTSGNTLNDGTPTIGARFNSVNELDGERFDKENPQPVNMGYPFLLPLISVPFYHLATLFSISPAKFVPFIVNPIIVSFTSVIIFSFGKRLFGSDRIGFILAIVYGMTSFVVPWTSEFFTRPLAALMVIAAVYFVYISKEDKKSAYAFLGGMFSLAVFLAQPASFIIILPILGYSLISLRKYKRLFFSYCGGALIIVLIQLIMNFLRFGSPLSFTYHGVQSLTTSQTWGHLFTSYEGFYGLLISPGWSVFLFYPISILIPISFYLLYKKDKSLAILFTVSLVVIWFYVGVQEYWTGFGGWGPRYLIPVLPLITMSLGIILIKFQSFKWITLFAGLTIIGFFVNLLGRLVWYKTGYTVYWDGLSSGSAIPGDLDWNINFSPIVNHFKIATSDWTILKWPNPGPEAFGYGIFLNQLYPQCRFDLFLYCNYGIVPVIILGTFMIIISLFILRLLKTPKVASITK